MLTPQQIEAHYSGIGGSMAAAILGVDKYQSPLEAYLLLTDKEYQEKHRKDLGFNLHIDIGRELEDIVAKHVSKEKNWELETVNYTKYDLQYPFLLGHPDRLIRGRREILEIKIRGNYAVRQYGEEDSDQVLDSDFVQLQHYIKLYDYDRGYLACLDLGTKTIRYYTVERDESFIVEVMRPVLVDFWENNVKKLIAPPPSTYEEAGQIWKNSIGEIAVGTPEIIKLAYRAKKAGDVKRRVDAKEKELKLEIAKFLEIRDTLVDLDLNPILTYKTQSADRIDVKRLRAEHPIIATDYTTSSSSRVMRFK